MLPRLGFSTFDVSGAPIRIGAKTWKPASAIQPHSRAVGGVKP